MMEKNLIQVDFDQKTVFLPVDHPILDIAARFWEMERYDAFKICYRTLRDIDDLIDNQKASGTKLLEREQRQVTTAVTKWMETIVGTKSGDGRQQQLMDVVRKFQIPLWPWKNFAQSMIYDIQHTGFATFRQFLRYAEGAAVAPACIGLHICGVVKKNDRYDPPPFDVQGAGRPSAFFCYLVHIMRDFEKDQKNNMNYFAQDIMKQCGVTSSMLQNIARGGEITRGFRKLMEIYYKAAKHYQQQTRSVLDKISRYLKPRYHLSLEVIYNLYSLIFDRIDVATGTFTADELNPTPNEMETRINLTVSHVYK